MDHPTLTAPASIPLPVRAQVFEAIASNSRVAGPIHDLARGFGVTPITLMNCLSDLVYAGRVTVAITAEGLVNIQLNRDEQVHP